MKYNEAVKLHELYLCGMGLSKLSKLHAPQYSSGLLHYYFKQFNLPIREKKKGPIREFNNRRYSFKKGYWIRTSQPRIPLQRDYYEFHKGPIPKDHNIGFIDGDPNNISLDNLKLIHKSEFGKWSLRKHKRRNKWT